jgi:chitin disaccharide deacetylase
VLIINADDWGRDRETTDRTLECIRHRSVSSVSAMVFMEDSDRAAAIALEQEIDAGLHLNLTTRFSGARASRPLIEHQARVAQYLRRHRFAQVVFHSGLARSFEYLVAAQLDEFGRLYRGRPDRIDGHHHMHLCANVVLQSLLPSGTFVRRNFSFKRGEKGPVNRMYRGIVDRLLRRRHGLMDFLFAMPPLDPPDHLERVFALARRFAVEVETHPVNPEEYRFLAGGEIFRRAAGLPVAAWFAAPGRKAPSQPAVLKMAPTR